MYLDVPGLIWVVWSNNAQLPLLNLLRELQTWSGTDGTEIWPINQPILSNKSPPAASSSSMYNPGWNAEFTVGSTMIAFMNSRIFRCLRLAWTRISLSSIFRSRSVVCGVNVTILQAATRWSSKLTALKTLFILMRHVNWCRTWTDLRYVENPPPPICVTSLYPMKLFIGMMLEWHVNWANCTEHIRICQLGWCTHSEGQVVKGMQMRIANKGWERQTPITSRDACHRFDASCHSPPVTSTAHVTLVVNAYHLWLVTRYLLLAWYWLTYMFSRARINMQQRNIRGEQILPCLSFAVSDWHGKFFGRVPLVRVTLDPWPLIVNIELWGTNNSRW